MKPRTITQTQADAGMRELGCQIRLGGTARGGAGLYCATHHEPAISDGPIRETCRTAANHARGICGHALCETRDTCALAA